MDNDLQTYKQISMADDGKEFDIKKIKSIIEGLLFASGEPLSIEDISDILQIEKFEVKKILDEMIVDFDRELRGIQIICFNDKYQMGTRPEHIEYIRKLLNPQSKQSLSRAALETIAIIAYKQPVTRQSIDSIRGVKSDRVIRNLIEKRLVTDVGRLDAPGKPILLGTTEEFLKYFGLKDLSELPKVEDLEI